MYACIWFDSACFNPWHECVLTQTYPLSTMEWMVWAEKGWKQEHDFSRMYQNFARVLACFLGQGSCVGFVYNAGNLQKRLEEKKQGKKIGN